MAFFSQYRWALTQTTKGLKNNKSLYLMTSLLAGLALSIPLLFSTLFYSLSQPLGSLSTAVEITVFAEKNINSTQLEQAINKLPGVKKTKLILKKDVFKDLNESLGIKHSKQVKNPLPDVIIVTLPTHANSEQIKIVAQKIEKLRYVDMVAYESSWHERWTVLTKAVYLGISCIGMIVLSLVILVLTSSIRIATQTGKQELVLLHLIGASSSFALRPYIWRAIFMMFTASLLSLGIVKSCFYILEPLLENISKIYDTNIMLQFPGDLYIALYVLCCILLGSFIATLAARDSWMRI